MNYFFDRLREERRRLGKNQQDFAALGGVKKDAQLNYENGSRRPDSDYLTAIANAGVDVQYVITGVRSPSTLTKEEVQLLEAYRTLDARGKATVIAILSALTGQEINSPIRNAFFHGNVGQAVQGDVNAPFEIHMPGKKKPK